MSMSPSSKFRERLLWTRVVFACAAAICVLSCNTVQADVTHSSEIVRKIVDDWNRRQQIRGFRYLVGGIHIVPKGWISQHDPPGLPRADVPSDEVVIEVKTEYFADLTRNRSRIERDFEIYDSEVGRFARMFEVRLYDGRTSQVFYPRDRNRDIFDEARASGPWQADLEFRSNDGPAFGRIDLPVLLAHGMVLDPGGSTLSPTGTLQRNLSADDFTLYGHAVRDGRECMVLRSQTDHTRSNPPYNEYWVDTERDSAIVRFVRYIRGSEDSQIDLWYNQDDGLGLPLARYVFMESFEGRLVRTREESVLEYEAEPAFADSLFYVEPQPGFNVADRVTNRRYRVGLPGQPDRDLAELAMEMDRGYRNTARRLLLLSMSLLLFLVGGFLCIHYVKRRKDRPV
jgi:hypothetical protein